MNVIVLGLGGVGSAACYALAKLGHRVIGIDQFSPPHAVGSSHGDTRIIRKSYFEHPSYVPLLIRAYSLWRELEESIGKQLYYPTGLLEIGPPEGVVLGGVKQSAAEHSLPIETMSMEDASKRYSGVRGDAAWQAILEKDAGYLLVEDCVAAHLDQARKLGAAISVHERIIDWESTESGVRVRTDRRVLEGDRMILSAGPWALQSLKSVQVPLRVLRKHLYWYACETEEYRERNGFPCFFFDTRTGYYYGFPDRDGGGLKVARHSGGEEVNGAIDGRHDRDDEDQRLVERFLREYLPGVSLEQKRWSGCYYTMTPDEHFIVDRHPEDSNVIVVAGLSGHGFKFTSVLGEIASELAVGREPSVDIGFLKIDRFQ